MIFRHPLLLTAAATLGLAISSFAQEVTDPTPSPSENSPSGLSGGDAPAVNGPRLKAPASSGLPAGETAAPSATEPQLMPDAVPTPSRSFDRPTRGNGVPAEASDVPGATEKTAPATSGKKGKKGPAIGTSKTEIFSQDVQDRIRLREVETRALADRAVQVQWEKSVAARNFPDRRNALKEYYRLLYARMEKMDGSLKKLIDVRADLVQKRLTQKFAPADSVTEADRSTSGQVFAD